MPTNDPVPCGPARALLIAPGDDAAVALDDLPGGAVIAVAGRQLTLRDAVPRGHKFAVRALDAGTLVRKYGFPIGRTSTPVPCGAWLHAHNLVTQLGGEERHATAE